MTLRDELQAFLDEMARRYVAGDAAGCAAMFTAGTGWRCAIAASCGCKTTRLSKAATTTTAPVSRASLDR